MRAIIFVVCLLLTCLVGCRASRPSAETFSADQLASLKWEDIVRRARGTEVSFAMWGGEEERNRFFRGAVTDRLREKYGSLYVSRRLAIRQKLSISCSLKRAPDT